MRALLAVAELRFRGAVASKIVWVVPAVFALAFAAARWAPGLDGMSRAAAADSLALALAGFLALGVALLIGATGLADDLRTGRLQAVLAAPVSRFTVFAGGVLGQGAFASLLLLAAALAATLGLDAGGLGSRARRAVVSVEPAEVLGVGPSGFADLDLANPEVKVRFRAPDAFDAPPGADLPVLRVHLAPRGQMETGSAEDGVVELGVHPVGGRATRTVRHDFKAGVPFFVDVPFSGIEPGADAEISVRRPRGAWRLRFAPDSVTVGHGRQLFVANVVKAVLCAIPLLLAGVAVGAVAASRLGTGAAAVFVLFLVMLFVARDAVSAGTQFILDRAAAQAEEEHAGHDHAGHDHDHDHAHGAEEHADEHDHTVRVSALETAVARVASVAIRAIPDPADHWRFGDLADGRAVTSRDIARSAVGAAPFLALLAAAGWLLLRRREVVPA